MPEPCSLGSMPGNATIRGPLRKRMSGAMGVVVAQASACEGLLFGSMLEPCNYEPWTKLPTYSLVGHQ